MNAQWWLILGVAAETICGTGQYSIDFHEVLTFAIDFHPVSSIPIGFSRFALISVDFLRFCRFQVSWRGGGAGFVDFSNSGAGEGGGLGSPCRVLAILLGLRETAFWGIVFEFIWSSEGPFWSGLFLPSSTQNVWLL